MGYRFFSSKFKSHDRNRGSGSGGQRGTLALEPLRSGPLGVLARALRRARTA